MKQFVDNQARSWAIRIDVNAIRRVRETLGLDLNRLMDDNSLLKSLAEDVCLLVDVVYVLVKTQCDAQQVSAEDFGASLYGDAIDQAAEVLLEAIVDFFPQRRRKPLQAALTASKKGQALAMEKLDTAIGQGLMEKQLNRDLAKIDDLLAKALS